MLPSTASAFEEQPSGGAAIINKPIARKRVTLPSLVNEHLGGLDDRLDRVADLEVHLIRRGARDRGDKLQVAHGHDNLSHDVAELDRLDRTLELIACAEHGDPPGSQVLPGNRLPARLLPRRPDTGA